MARTLQGMTKKPRQFRPVDRCRDPVHPEALDELATGHFISNNNLRFPQEPRGCALIVRDVLGDHTGSARFRCLSRRNHSGTRQARPGELIPAIPLVVVELDLTE